MRYTATALLPLVASVLTGCPSRDLDLVVDTGQDTSDVDVGDGQCADEAGRCSLRAAVEEGNAANSAIIRLRPGETYALTQNGELEVTGDLTILGATDENGNVQPGLAHAVIIPDAGDRLFSIGTGDSFAQLKARGLTLRGARLPSGGGGAYAGGIAYIHRGSSFEGQSLNVLDNVAEKGAAFINEGLLRISGGNISGNRCNQVQLTRGGAIHNIGTLDLESVSLTDNVCDSGGAISSRGGGVELRSVTLANNLAYHRGAAISSENSELRISNSTIVENAQQLGARPGDVTGPAIAFEGARHELFGPDREADADRGAEVFASGRCTSCHNADDGPGEPLSLALMTPNKYARSALAAKIYSDMDDYLPMECEAADAKVGCALDVAAYLLDVASVPGTEVVFGDSPQLTVKNSIVARNHTGSGSVANCSVEGDLSADSVGNVWEDNAWSSCVAALPSANTLVDAATVDNWTFTFVDPANETEVTPSCDGDSPSFGYSPACWSEFTFGSSPVVAQCEDASGRACATSAGATGE